MAGLLVATTAAFAVTEKLKLTQSPIVGTIVDKTFSPICDCATDTARISFVLRKSDRLDVAIVDRAGTIVRELARGQSERRGRVAFVWDGRDDAGAVVREGEYQPRVHLGRQRRTIVMPNRIAVDVTPPHLVSFTARPRVISPDGDGRHDYAKIEYRYDQRVRVELHADGIRALRRLGTSAKGRFDWNGIAGGERLPAGPARLTLRARDVAGNPSRESRPRVVLIQFVALARRRLVAPPGGSVKVLVVTQARRYQWRFAGHTGVARPGTLRLRAPDQEGRFVLTVTANAHSDRAIVVVRPVSP